MVSQRASERAAAKTSMLPAGNWQIKADQSPLPTVLFSIIDDKLSAMKKIVLMITIALAIHSHTYAQVTNRENYDIKAPKDTRTTCKRLYDILEQTPADVRFGTQFVGDSIFIIHNDIEWLTQVIQSKSDGFAIDLVQKQQ